MSRVATAAVRLAAALMPAHSRERYREQWLGELRDAPELGIRSSEIAIGSLAFAATLARPMPGGMRVGENLAARRSRRALALSLSAAAVGVSQYASAVSFGGLSGDFAHGFTLFVGTALLYGYWAIAPVIAIVMALATRGVAPSVRASVGFLALASWLPLFADTVDGALWQLAGSPRDGLDTNIYVTSGKALYAVAGIIIAVVVTTCWRRWWPVSRRAPRDWRARLTHAGTASVSVAVVMTVSFVGPVAAWTARQPPVFGDHVQYRAAWLAQNAQIEQMVNNTFTAWAAAGILLVCGVFAAGWGSRASRLRSRTLVLLAMCAILLTYGAMANFVSLLLPGIHQPLPTDLVVLAARVGVVLVILTTSHASGTGSKLRQPIPEAVDGTLGSSTP